jgi:RNase H-fold protein (predicted Holliday junction resolvase)
VTVLGLDPGTRKCGFALVEAIGRAPLTLGIVPLDALRTRLAELLRLRPVKIAAIGRGTNAGAVAAVVRDLGLDVAFVDERETTLLARKRYFDDHPPRGLRALVPRGLLIPDRPIDDYAALLIAERFLRTPAGGEEHSLRRS